MTSQNKIKVHAVWLDVLKTLAMLGVILIHYNIAYPCPNILVRNGCSIGARCPQLFFIISGYLTWMSISDAKIGVSFFKKRFFRIAPIFYFACLLAIFVPVIQSVSALNIVSHFLFMNGLWPLYTDSIIGVEWYIADLALFYFLCPFLRKFICDLKTGVTAFCIAAVLSSITLIVYNCIEAEKSIEVQMFFETFFIVHQLPILILGIILFYLINQTEYKKRIPSILVWGAVLCVCVLAVFIFFNLNKRFMTSSFVAGLTFAWLFLFVYKIQSFFNHMAWIPLTFIGVHSFGIYCFHQIVINTVKHFYSSNHSSIILWGMYFVFILIVSSLIGYLSEFLQKKLISGKVK